MEVPLLQVLAVMIAVGVAYLVGRTRKITHARIKEREEIAGMMNVDDLEEQKTRELVDRIAAKRFPSLAGR